MTTGLPRLTISRRTPAPLAAVALTKRGATAAATLSAALPLDAYVPAKLGAGDAAVSYTEPVRELLSRLFNEYHGLVLFMALGAAVRLLSPLLKSKRDDPAVVVVDEACTFAISVLSGHFGGANALAHQVGAVLHATPVITTGSDALALPALDLLGAEAGWRCESDAEHLKGVMAALLNERVVAIYQDAGSPAWQQQVPAGQRRVIAALEFLEDLPEEVAAVIVISDARDIPALRHPRPCVVYRPPTLVAGTGCSRGTPATEIAALIHETLQEAKKSPSALSSLATIDIKRDEPGIAEAAARFAVPIRYYSSSALATVAVPSPSEAVRAATGSPSICEAAALLASGARTLLVTKRKTQRVTAALAQIPEAAPWR